MIAVASFVCVMVGERPSSAELANQNCVGFMTGRVKRLVYDLDTDPSSINETMFSDFVTVQAVIDTIHVPSESHR